MRQYQRIRHGKRWLDHFGAGRDEVTLETLPDSMLPDQLRELGYDVTEIGEGEGIVAHAVAQKLTLTSCGVFEEMTPGSTKPVVQMRTHAAIVCILRFAFALA
jgi:hypothetical protein